MSPIYQSIVVQGSLKHPIKSHNFNLAFNRYKEIKLIEFLKTSTGPVHREMNL
jgi:hypothetical protein